MGSGAKMGELKRAAQQLGVTSTTLREHGWKTAPAARIEAVKNNPPGWLHKQDIGWVGHWTCDGCGAVHQRDDNASINLARYEATAAMLAAGSAVGPVGAAVKRGADRKTGPRPAGGREARKGSRRKPAEQPRDGVLV